MKYSSFRLKIVVAAMIANLCPQPGTSQILRDSDAIPREVLEKARASIVVLTGEDKAGQPIAPGIGFWIGRNLIATDNRVVQSAVRVHVTVPGQDSAPMDVMSRDSYRFATILTVTKTQAAPLLLGDSDKVAVNDRMYLVGDPQSQQAAADAILRRIVTFNERRYFEITAPMSSTGRGGPVLNNKGEVIGIAGEGPEGKGLGYAIPASYLTTLLRARDVESPSDTIGTGPGSSSGGGVGSGGRTGSGTGTGSGAPSPGRGQPGSGYNTSGGSSPAPVATRPVVLNNVRPRYTEEARRNQTQGVVRIRIMIGADGDVKQAKVTKGLPDGLNEQAIEAAYQLKFKPATRNGVAVQFSLAMEVEFNLR